MLAAQQYQFVEQKSSPYQGIIKQPPEVIEPCAQYAFHVNHLSVTAL